MTASTVPQVDIRYDRVTKDFSVTIDGEYIGSRDTRVSAESLANTHLLSLIELTLTRMAQRLEEAGV